MRDGEIVLDGSSAVEQHRRPSPSRPPRSPTAAGPADELLRGSATGATSGHWTSDDTDALLDVLRHGGPRAVRLLDVTGRPRARRADVAEAVARRRADPSELDPGRVLRFPTVARLDELLADTGAGSRWSERATATSSPPW